MNETEARGRLDDARRQLDALGIPLETIGRGWATVDLDRAEQELRGRIAHRHITPAPDDDLLAARCRIVAAIDGPLIVLLEPSTEGPLAATLARYGEGLIVEYLAPMGRDADVVGRAASAGIGLSAAADGPLGRSRLVLAGGRWGPHLILVEHRDRGAPEPPAATIER
jgi:hypothetical protein